MFFFIFAVYRMNEKDLLDKNRELHENSQAEATIFKENISEMYSLRLLHRIQPITNIKIISPKVMYHPCPELGIDHNLWSKFCKLIDTHNEMNLLMDDEPVLEGLGRLAISELLRVNRFYSVFNMLSSDVHMRRVLQKPYSTGIGGAGTADGAIAPLHRGSLFHILVAYGNVRLMEKYTYDLARYEYRDMTTMITSANINGEKCVDVIRKYPQMELMLTFLETEYSKYSLNKQLACSLFSGHGLTGIFSKEFYRRSCICKMFPEDNFLMTFKPYYAFLCYNLMCHRTCTHCNSSFMIEILKDQYYKKIDGGRFYNIYKDITYNSKKLTIWNDLDDRKRLIYMASSGLNQSLHEILLTKYSDEYTFDNFFELVGSVLRYMNFWSIFWNLTQNINFLDTVLYAVCDDLKHLGYDILDAIANNMMEPNATTTTTAETTASQLTLKFKLFLKTLKVLCNNHPIRNSMYYTGKNKKTPFTIVHTAINCENGYCRVLLFLCENIVVPLMRRFLDTVDRALGNSICVKLSLNALIITPTTEYEYWALSTPAVYLLKSIIGLINIYQKVPLSKTRYEKIVNRDISPLVWELIVSNLCGRNDVELDRKSEFQYISSETNTGSGTNNNTTDEDDDDDDEEDTNDATYEQI